MRSTRSIRHHARPIGITAVVSLLAAALIGLAPAASADGASISQSTPLEGAALAGQAFNTQLQVGGANGTVTFAQTTGSDVTVSTNGAVSAPSSLANGVYTASGTDSDTSGDTGTWNFTLSVVPPAPSGFSGTIVSVYQSVYNVAQQLDQSSALQTVDQYQQQVSQMSPDQLADFYNATQQNPEWYQIPSLMETVSSGLPGVGAGPNSTTSTSASVAATEAKSAIKAGSSVAVGVPSRSQTVVTPKSAGTSTTASTIRTAGVAADSTSSSQTPVSTFTPAVCPVGPPDSEIFALQITVDALQGVYNILMATAVAAVDVLSLQAPIGAAAAADAGALIGVVIAHDTLVYEQEAPNECLQNNILGYVSNLDNTTTQTYALLSTLGQTLSQLQSTDGQTQTDVLNLEDQLTSFQTTLNQTIATDTQTIQNTVGSDSQGVTSQLEVNLAAMQTDLTTIQGDETNLSQLVTTQTNTSTSTIQASLSSALSQILSQTSTVGQGITNLVTQDNQQVINTLQSNFATQQNEYESNLTLEIERGLSQWGSIVPQVQFMLPTSQGGYLNSTPVGVQEVVTNDMKALNAMGVKITSSATGDLNAANAALAAGKYTTAYQDYASCYEAMA